MNIPFLAGAAIFVASLLVGGFASYRNIREAQGPRERAYVFRTCAYSWALILSMLAFAYFLTAPLRYYVIGGYFLVTPFLFYRWATNHQLIRVAERRSDGEGKPA